LSGAAGGPQSPPPVPTADETRAIETKLADPSARINTLVAKKIDPALLADVEIYRRAAEFIVRFPEDFASRAFVADTLAVLDTGLGGARELDARAASRPKRKGPVRRGYLSR